MMARIFLFFSGSDAVSLLLQSSHDGICDLQLNWLEFKKEKTARVSKQRLAYSSNMTRNDSISVD